MTQGEFRFDDELPPIIESKEAGDTHQCWGRFDCRFLGHFEVTGEGIYRQSGNWYCDDHFESQIANGNAQFPVIKIIHYRKLRNP